MSVYLVRHAKAGSRSEFDGDDRDRPLTNSGRRQAEELARRLAAVAPSTIVSSPYARCVQTVEPLAVAADLEIRTSELLGELGSEHASVGQSVMKLIDTLPDGAVLCSHGDVIPAIIKALQDGGLNIRGDANWQKASVWVLERIDGRFDRATSWPPPNVD